MNSEHGTTKQRRAMSGWLALATCSALAACGTSSKNEDADSTSSERSVLPPSPHMQSQPMATPTAEMQTAIELPKPAPGGQSGSDSGGSMACPETFTPLAPDDATPWGMTLAELDAQVSDQLQAKSVPLIWLVGEWKPTALSFTLELDPADAMSGVSDSTVCDSSKRVLQGARVHLHSEDGVLDDDFDTQLRVNGDDTLYNSNMFAEIAGEQLAASALGRALVERGAIDGLTTVDRYDHLELQLGWGSTGEQSVNGSLQLWLREDENSTRATLTDLGTISSSEPLPSPRVAIEPPAGLAGSCTALGETLPLEPPNLEYEDRLPVLAGTWVLCGGDRAEPIAIDYVGVVIADDGSFVQVVQNQDGALRQHLGFGHQGTIQIDDAMMGTLQLHGVSIRELLLNTSDGLVGGGSSRIELSADRKTMRWYVESEVDQDLELVYQRSDLPVIAAEASSFTIGERAGAAACSAEERDLHPASSLTDWQDVIGSSWTWCSGASGDAVGGTLELGAVGDFRQLGLDGRLLSAGSYALMQGNPSEVHYLQFTPDAGTPWVMFGLLASDTPRKLMAYTDADTAMFHMGVLSAMP
jgi:hypothetical protein